MTCAPSSSVKWHQCVRQHSITQLKPDGSLLSDLITLLLLFQAIIAFQCLRRKRCHRIRSLLPSDLQDEAFNAELYCSPRWHKENLIRKEEKYRFELGKQIEFLIASVTFWFQASLHARSEVSSVWAVKLPLSLSSLRCNHVICFSHWVCFTSQNHSGTVSLSGFHHRASCRSSSSSSFTAALCLLLLDRIALTADMLDLWILRCECFITSWHFSPTPPEHSKMNRDEATSLFWHATLVVERSSFWQSSEGWS